MYRRKLPLHIGIIAILFSTLACNGLFGALVATYLAQDEALPTSNLAPDFELTTFDGETIWLSDFRGSIVVINFWSSWAAPCRDEAPVLQRIWEQYQDQGVIFVGIAYSDTQRNALAFIDEYDITYPNGPDVGLHISDDYHITGVPETFVVDQNGNIAHSIIGLTSEAQLRDIIDRLLTGK